MRIACSRCQTKFDVPEHRLAGGAVKVRCSECGNTFVVRRRVRATEEDAAQSSSLGVSQEGAAQPLPEARRDDFDPARFQYGTGSGAGISGLQPGTGGGPPGETEEDTRPPGEPDLGDLSGLEQDLESLGELDLGGLEDALGDPDLAIEEPLQRVKEEELVSLAKGTGGGGAGTFDEAPRLDIQRGPRRFEGPEKSPVVARDRRHSPLLWVVVVAAVAAIGFTGYLVYTGRDAAFTFLNPSKIGELWQRRSTEAKLEAVDLKAYAKDLSAGRRMYIIEGNVLNRSTAPQSLIKVRGELFGLDGGSVAKRDVYCGNVLSESELATLPLPTIEARLQNQVGEGLRNVDIAPQSKVPFMVVFPDPPAEVSKFNVLVTEARPEAGP